MVRLALEHLFQEIVGDLLLTARQTGSPTAPSARPRSASEASATAAAHPSARSTRPRPPPATTPVLCSRQHPGSPSGRGRGARSRSRPDPHSHAAGQADPRLAARDQHQLRPGSDLVDETSKNRAALVSGYQMHIVQHKDEWAALAEVGEVAIPLLAADLGERDPFVLVLDDVHLITAKKSRAVLACLVDQVRSGSQLVLVARGEPGVPLGRLRASGDLVEIGTALLALDPTETRDVAASTGLELSQAAAGALWTKGGIAPAVALASLALRGRADGAVRAAGLSGSQQQIADDPLEGCSSASRTISSASCSGRRSSTT